MSNVFDPAEVEAAHGRTLPRPRLLKWELIYREGVVELVITSVEAARQCRPVRVPAELIEHLLELVRRGLDNMHDRLAELPLDADNNFVAGELAGYRMLLTRGTDERWVSLTHDDREIASVPWIAGTDFFSALASAQIVLLHYGVLRLDGPAN